MSPTAITSLLVLLVAVGLIAAGAALIYGPAGLIVGGLGLGALVWPERQEPRA